MPVTWSLAVAPARHAAYVLVSRVTQVMVPGAWDRSRSSAIAR